MNGPASAESQRSAKLVRKKGGERSGRLSQKKLFDKTSGEPKMGRFRTSFLIEPFFGPSPQRPPSSFRARPGTRTRARAPACRLWAPQRAAAAAAPCPAPGPGAASAHCPKRKGEKKEETKTTLPPTNILWMDEILEC